MSKDLIELKDIYCGWRCKKDECEFDCKECQVDGFIELLLEEEVK